MRWSELQDGQPGLAVLGQRRLLEPGVVLVATIRGDGTPRLSPVEPLVMDGNLWLSMLWQSRKAADLLRDPRILVHSVITSRMAVKGSSRSAESRALSGAWSRSAATPIRRLTAWDGARIRGGSTCSPSASPR
jgi:Pyridoxamine 5'-phosphate oxidase